MEFKPVKTKRTSETILDQIKELLINGQLNPGDKLLTERELAEQLQVSRASVREALSALNLAGILEIRHGEGIYVRKPEGNEIIEPLTFIILLEKNRIGNILEVRKALEVESAGLAAERATEVELQEIAAAVERMREDVTKGLPGEEADLQFHYAIAAATHNYLLNRLMNTIHEAIRESLALTRKLWLSASSDTEYRLYEEHQMIYRAIAARDKDTARSLMYNHLRKVETELLRVCQEHGIQ
ncbi:FadR/GntR family transcriptional regulator [Desulfurispora thermophila]|uniref:FadR/GntR family transcriptional regulator n=1 Tax=Desulfurispora thermophila TaxID=265470 RepID=UPI0003605C3A|nr:FadR/GntR family transcriptional regulator [Desulfurispora thermophila]